MRKCPDCGIEIRGNTCSGCGWSGGAKPHPYRWATKVEGEWIDLQCAFNDLGMRCDHYGTMSPSTNGRGPWYCRQHFGPSGVMDYRTSPLPRVPSGLKALRAQLAMREPGEDG